MPIAAAALSRMRSTIWVASGRPAPRYAPIGVVLVMTVCETKSMTGMSYTAWLSIPVSIGRIAPMIG